MSEQIQAIIDRARALLTAATPGPWEVCPDLRPDIRSQSGTGGFLGCGHIATVSRYDANESDAALIAAAPELLAVLCDALDRAQFAAEWWAEERTIEIEALREAWAVMDSMARAAGVVGAFLEQAAPLLRPDASGNVKAPNHVTAAFTDGVQSYEITIRREGGKTPAEIIGELTARAESAERRVEEADELYRSIKAKVGQTPGDGLMVHDAIDALMRRAEEAEAERDALRAELAEVAHDSTNCLRRRAELVAECAALRAGRDDPPAADRERLGMRVREVWIKWAKEQPAPKPSWLVPWDELPEPDKEVDRRIGERLVWATRIVALHALVQLHDLADLFNDATRGQSSVQLQYQSQATEGFNALGLANIEAARAALGVHENGEGT